jgi:tRNA(fMet)-specific endonuclease VapC
MTISGIYQQSRWLELSAGSRLSLKSDTIEKTKALLAYVEIVNLTGTIAREGGEICPSFKEREKIEFNDCLIAATVLSLDIREIITRNCDHLTRINNLTAIVPEDLEF